MARKPEPDDADPGGTGDAADSTLAGQVKESAQQIWLAGMGAFARAQAEGSKVFESLVKEGATLQKKTQSAAEGRLGDVASRMSAMAGDVQARAGQQWDKLEGLFEQRTAKALKGLGVPTARDIDALSRRVDELGAEVARLAKAVAAKPTAAKRAARPPTAHATPRKTRP